MQGLERDRKPRLPIEGAEDEADAARGRGPLDFESIADDVTRLHGEPSLSCIVVGMAGGALFQWRDVLFQCVGFLASFGTLGAIGFRYGVALGPGVSRAGAVGMVGAALGGVGLVVSLFARAASKHTTFAAAVSAGGGMLIAQTALLVVLLVAFVLAWRRVAAAWPVAAVCALALPLRGIVGGVWAKMVNPLHVVGA